MNQSRGWVRDGGLTDEGLAARLGIEQRTDAQEQPIVAALGDRLDEVCGRLNHWGQLCVEADAFPPDILKRAAGWPPSPAGQAASRRAALPAHYRPGRGRR